MAGVKTLLELKSSLVNLKFPQDVVESLDAWILDTDEHNINGFLRKYGNINTSDNSTGKTVIIDGNLSEYHVHDTAWCNFAVALATCYYNDTTIPLYEGIRDTDHIHVYAEVSTRNDFISVELLNGIADAILVEYRNVYMVDYGNQKPEVRFVWNHISNRANQARIYFPTLVTRKRILEQILASIRLNMPRYRDYINPECKWLSFLYMKTVGLPNQIHSVYALRDVDRTKRDSEKYEIILDLVRYRIRAFGWEQPPSYRSDSNLFTFITYNSNGATLDPFTDERYNEVAHLIDTSVFEIARASNGLVLQRRRPARCEMCTNSVIMNETERDEVVHSKGDAAVYSTDGTTFIQCHTGHTKPLAEYDNKSDTDVTPAPSRYTFVPRDTPSTSVSAVEPQPVVLRINKSVYKPASLSTPVSVEDQKPIALKLNKPAPPSNVSIIPPVVPQVKPVAKQSAKDKKPKTMKEKIDRLDAQVAQLRSKLAFAYPPYVDYEEYNEQMIRPFRTDRKLQVVQSKMDSHKTNRTISFIKDNLTTKEKPGHIKSVCFISIRRKFSENMVARFNDAGLKMDNYMTNDISNSDFCVISPESLHRIKRVKYDLIIIDECTSFTMQMNSGLHNSMLDANRTVLLDLINLADYVIAMDADIDLRIFGLLHHACPNDTIYFQRNLAIRGPSIQVRYMPSEDHWKHMIDLKLDQHKNIAIVMGSSQKGRDLEMYFKTKGYNCRYYYKDGENYKGDFIVGINKTIRDEEVQIIMYTSTINVGVDINEGWFHCMFVYGSSKSNYVREVKQMMGRIRILIDNEIYVFNNVVHMNNPTHPYAIRQNIEYQLQLCNAYLHAVLSPAERMYSVEGEQRVWKLKDGYWVDLLLDCLSEVNMSRNYFDVLFHMMIRDQGFTIITDECQPLPKTIKDQLKQRDDEISDLIGESDVDDFNNSRYITDPVEYRALQRKNNRGESSRAEKLHLIKTNFLRLFTSPLEINAIDFFRNKYMTHVWNVFHELRLGIHQTVITDLRRFVGEKLLTTSPRFLKCFIVRCICAHLGFKSSVDCVHEISENRIRNYMQQWVNAYDLIKPVFNYTGKRPSDYKTVVAMIRCVFTSWSGNYLVSIPKDRTVDGVRITTQTLALEDKNESLVKLVGLLNARYIPEFPRDFDVEVQAYWVYMARLQSPDPPPYPEDFRQTGNILRSDEPSDNQELASLIENS